VNFEWHDPSTPGAISRREDQRLVPLPVGARYSHPLRLAQGWRRDFSTPGAVRVYFRTSETDGLQLHVWVRDLTSAWIRSGRLP
jgi:hypothetical protein